MSSTVVSAPQIQALGHFAVDDLTGAATYTLPIALPPLPKGPQLAVSLRYDSQGGSNTAGAGWGVHGIPTVKKRGNAYFCDDVIIDVTVREDGALEHRPVNGGLMLFGEKRGTVQWGASRIEDIYGNFIDISYIDGKPHKIAYGLNGERAGRQMICRYGDDGLLDYIGTSVGGEAVRSYDLWRKDGMVQEIVMTAHGDTGDVATSVIFASVDGRLAAITEPSGLVTAIEYRTLKTTVGERPVVAGYHLTFPGLEGEETYRFFRHYDGGQEDRDLQWTFGKTIEWDEAARSGREVIFGNRPELARKIVCLRRLVAQGASNEGEKHPDFSQDGTAYVKTAETTYTYDVSKTMGHDPRLIAIEQTDYSDDGQRLHSKCEYIDYNRTGLPIRRRTDETTEFYDYIRVSSPTEGTGQEICLPAGAAIYAGQLTSPLEDKCLKRTDIDYEFNHPTHPCAPTAAHERSWIGVKEGMSAPESTFFNHTGNPKRTKNILGVETVIEYDAFHFPNKIVHISADGDRREERYETDPAHGRTVRAWDHNGAPRTTAYDAFGSPVEEWGIDLSRPDTWRDEAKMIRHSGVRWRRDDKKRLSVRETLSGEQRQRDYFDGLGRLVRSERKISGGRWQAQLTRYGSRDRIVCQSLPYLITSKNNKEASPQWVEKIFDAHGREVGEKFPDGRMKTKEISTDPANATVTIHSYAVSPDGEKRLTAREIYVRGRLVEQQKLPDSASTQFAYDALGRLILETDPSSAKTHYAYDGLDRVVREENPTRGVRAYVFDRRGLLTRTDFNGLPMVYSYDGFGRMIRKEVACDPAGNMAPMVYQAAYQAATDHAGERVIEILPDGHRLDITYAPHGKEWQRTFTVKDGPSFTLVREFSLHGEDAATIYPNGRKVRTLYAASGLLRKVLWADEAPEGWGSIGDAIVEYQGHDGYGRPTRTHFHNGVSEIRSANEFGDTISLTIGRRHARSVPYLHHEYGPNPAGDGALLDLIDRSDPTEPKSYGFRYDGAGRLRSVQYPWMGRHDTFEFGVASNVMKISRQEGGIDVYEGYLYKTDGNGNILAKEGLNQTWAHRFDADNRLLQTSVHADGAAAVHAFAYDMDGERVVKTSPDGVRAFYIAADYLVTLYPDGGSLGTIKIPGVDGVAAAVTEVIGKAPDASFYTAGRYTPGILYLHYNNLGSTILATDKNGKKVAAIGFEATGRVTEETIDGEWAFDLYFAGMLYDPGAGCYYAGDRYYDPDSMRFLSPDRARSSTDPYGYANGDPINYIDWDGLCGLCERLGRWWRKAKTCRIGSRLTRVFTVIAGTGGATFAVLTQWFNPTLITPANLVGTMVFMLSFSVANQTIDYITTGRHNRSCLSCLWERICCCRQYCITNRFTISLVVNTALSTVLFPISYLFFNAFSGANGVPVEVILWSMPRGVVAGIMSSLAVNGVFSSVLPFLRFSTQSVFGSVLTELVATELAYLAFTAGDIAVQVLMVPPQYFNFTFQSAFSRSILLIAPFTARANPLVAILPISNIPWITSGPMMLENGDFAPFWPCLCGTPPENDSSDEHSSDEGDGIIVEVVEDDESGSNNQQNHDSNGGSSQDSDNV